VVVGGAVAGVPVVGGDVDGSVCGAVVAVTAVVDGATLVVGGTVLVGGGWCGPVASAGPGSTCGVWSVGSSQLLTDRRVPAAGDP
jgi:hypothetical protein